MWHDWMCWAIGVLVATDVVLAYAYAKQAPVRGGTTWTSFLSWLPISTVLTIVLYAAMVAVVLHGISGIRSTLF